MNGFVATSLKSGLLLHSEQYVESFGMGVFGKDAMQMSSALFAVYQQIESEQRRQTIHKGDVLLIFDSFETEKEGFLLVAILNRQLPVPAAHEVLSVLGRTLSRFDMDGSHSPRPSTVRLLKHEIQAAYRDIFKHFVEELNKNSPVFHDTGWCDICVLMPPLLRVGDAAETGQPRLPTPVATADSSGERCSSQKEDSEDGNSTWWRLFFGDCIDFRRREPNDQSSQNNLPTEFSGKEVQCRPSESGGGLSSVDVDSSGDLQPILIQMDQETVDVVKTDLRHQFWCDLLTSAKGSLLDSLSEARKQLILTERVDLRRLRYAAVSFSVVVSEHCRSLPMAKGDAVSPETNTSDVRLFTHEHKRRTSGLDSSSLALEDADSYSPAKLHQAVEERTVSVTIRPICLCTAAEAPEKRCSVMLNSVEIFGIVLLWTSWRFCASPSIKSSVETTSDQVADAATALRPQSRMSSVRTRRASLEGGSSGQKRAQELSASEFLRLWDSSDKSKSG